MKISILNSTNQPTFDSDIPSGTPFLQTSINADDEIYSELVTTPLPKTYSRSQTFADAVSAARFSYQHGQQHISTGEAAGGGSKRGSALHHKANSPTPSPLGQIPLPPRLILPGDTSDADVCSNGMVSSLNVSPSTASLSPAGPAADLVGVSLNLCSPLRPPPSPSLDQSLTVSPHQSSRPRRTCSAQVLGATKSSIGRFAAIDVHRLATFVPDLTAAGVAAAYRIAANPPPKRSMPDNTDREYTSTPISLRFAPGLSRDRGGGPALGAPDPSTSLGMRTLDFSELSKATQDPTRGYDGDGDEGGKVPRRFTDGGALLRTHVAPKLTVWRTTAPQGGNPDEPQTNRPQPHVGVQYQGTLGSATGVGDEGSMGALSPGTPHEKMAQLQQLHTRLQLEVEATESRKTEAEREERDLQETTADMEVQLDKILNEAAEKVSLMRCHVTLELH